MTWTRINPEDPRTYPESGKKVDFVLVRNGAEILCVGKWGTDGRETWTDSEESDAYGPEEYQAGEVTHWRPRPALPGEEAEAKSTTGPAGSADAATREDADAPPEVGAAIAAAQPTEAGHLYKAEHPAELVERVAKAIYLAKYGYAHLWSGLADEKKDDFRRYARAAIEAIPRPAAPTPDWDKMIRLVRGWHERYWRLMEDKGVEDAYAEELLEALGLGPVVVPEQEKKL